MSRYQHALSLVFILIVLIVLIPYHRYNRKIYDLLKTEKIQTVAAIELLSPTDITNKLEIFFKKAAIKDPIIHIKSNKVSINYISDSDLWLYELIYLANKVPNLMIESFEQRLNEKKQIESRICFSFY